ncbi:MAG: nickel pincer cofactor biosynthesis protein LarB [Bdellovibrionales bacterium]|nr:nickel pincer cofactor biosynthesis protein LarB [Bdellovibrionales bacterium]
MDQDKLLRLLEQVATGRTTPEEVLEHIAVAPFTDIGHSRIDFHRMVRCGFEEVVYAAGKDLDALKDIIGVTVASMGRVLLTRLPESYVDSLSVCYPDLVFHPRSRSAAVVRESAPRLNGSVAVLSAGTSDAAVAEEALVCAEFLGADVTAFRDVGVAGLQRLLSVLEELRTYDVLVVVAGMEGALPGVVAGLTAAPVIAVPTSVGYGAAFGGITALCGMLISCSPGLTVVNIDNGFGAALAATRMLKHIRRTSDAEPKDL